MTLVRAREKTRKPVENEKGKKVEEGEKKKKKKNPKIWGEKMKNGEKN